MTEVIEIEAVVNSVVIEEPSSESSVLVEVVEGEVVDVDGEPLAGGGGTVEVADGPVQAVEIFEAPTLEVIEVEGARGQDGAPGAPGAPGESPGDIPDMTLIFENGLI